MIGMKNEPLDTGMGAGIGALCSVGLAIVLIPLRNDLANNAAALLMVLPVLLAAVIGGWKGGALSALVATLSFDFFFTRPYGSLAMTSREDTQTAIALLLVGSVAGLLAGRAQRATADARSGHSSVQRIHRVTQMIAHGDDATRVIDTVRQEVTELLSAKGCRFEPGTALGAPPAIPRIEATGALNVPVRRYLSRGFVLPAEGVEIEVVSGGVAFGRLVVQSDPTKAVTLDQRIAAVVLANALGRALEGDPVHSNN